MAFSQSMTHARLMGADSLEASPKSALTQTLPSQRSGGFFVFPARGDNEFLSAEAERETRISGARACVRVLHKRGACRRERRVETRGPPMAGRTLKGSLGDA